MRLSAAVVQHQVPNSWLNEATQKVCFPAVITSRTTLNSQDPTHSFISNHLLCRWSNHGNSKKTCMKQIQVQDSLDDHKRVLDHFWRWQSHHQPLLSSLAIATKPKEAREHSGSSWEAHSLKIAFLGKPQEKKNALQSSRDGSILPTSGADFGF